MKLSRNYSFAAIPTCLALLLASSLHGQTEGGDWDAYVMKLSGGKPVSTVLDLSLADRAPLKDKGYAILVRTELLSPDAEGMPGRRESESLHRIEDLMEKSMVGGCGAVYAGRYTHKGVREFVFYLDDTASYRKGLEAAFTASPDHKWKAWAVADTAWSNYFDVLYPPPAERERIRNRRLVDILADKGDALKTPRRVDHFLRFRTKTSREAFVRTLQNQGFEIEKMPEADEAGDFPYALQVYRKDVPGYPMVDRVVVPMWEKAMQGNGRYEGWETYLVKLP